MAIYLTVLGVWLVAAKAICLYHSFFGTGVLYNYKIINSHLIFLPASQILAALHLYQGTRRNFNDLLDIQAGIANIINNVHALNLNLSKSNILS